MNLCPTRQHSQLVGDDKYRTRMLRDRFSRWRWTGPEITGQKSELDRVRQSVQFVLDPTTRPPDTPKSTAVRVPISITASLDTNYHKTDSLRAECRIRPAYRRSGGVGAVHRTDCLVSSPNYFYTHAHVGILTPLPFAQTISIPSRFVNGPASNAARARTVSVSVSVVGTPYA